MTDQPDAQGPTRASDAEREAVVGRLNAACGEGRLTLTEFSERVQGVYEARTRGELDRFVADLPAASSSSTAVEPATTGRTDWHLTPLGGLSRSGRWRMASRTVLVTLLGGARLDLGEAELAAPVVTLTKVSIIGGVSLRVPPGVRVEVSGFSLLGGRSLDVDDAPPSSPTVRVRHFGIIGGVSARSTRPLDRWRRALNRHLG